MKRTYAELLILYSDVDITEFGVFSQLVEITHQPNRIMFGHEFHLRFRGRSIELKVSIQIIISDGYGFVEVIRSSFDA